MRDDGWRRAWALVALQAIGVAFAVSLLTSLR
jgi:hypothetical protein